MLHRFISKIYALELPRKMRIIRRIPFIWPLLRHMSYTLMQPETQKWCTVRTGVGKGIHLYLDPRYEARIWQGKHEPEVQALLADTVKPGMVVYDVGAHLGFFSVLSARMVGPSGKVFAFEANPDVAERIVQNRDRNNLPHVYVLPRAVWHTNNGVSFGRALHHTTGGTSSIALAASNQGDDVISVPSICLDDFMQINLPPDVIKMDIEGAEIEALQGAEMLFSQKQPILICEVHHQQATDFVTQFLKRHRYSLEWKDASHVLALPPN